MRELEWKQNLRKRGGLWHPYFQMLPPLPCPLIYAELPFSDGALQLHLSPSKKPRSTTQQCWILNKTQFMKGVPIPGTCCLNRRWERMHGCWQAGNSELNDYRGQRNHLGTALPRAAHWHHSACVLTPQELSAPRASTLHIMRYTCWGGPCPVLHHLWKPPCSTRPGCCPSACPLLPQHSRAGCGWCLLGVRWLIPTVPWQLWACGMQIPPERCGGHQWSRWESGSKQAGAVLHAAVTRPGRLFVKGSWAPYGLHEFVKDRGNHLITIGGY